jgi:hypothetical protein
MYFVRSKDTREEHFPWEASVDLPFIKAVRMALVTGLLASLTTWEWLSSVA